MNQLELLTPVPRHGLLQPPLYTSPHRSLRGHFTCGEEKLEDPNVAAHGEVSAVGLAVPAQPCNTGRAKRRSSAPGGRRQPREPEASRRVCGAAGPRRFWKAGEHGAAEVCEGKAPGAEQVGTVPSVSLPGRRAGRDRRRASAAPTGDGKHPAPGPFPAGREGTKGRGPPCGRRARAASCSTASPSTGHKPRQRWRCWGGARETRLGSERATGQAGTSRVRCRLWWERPRAREPGPSASPAEK